MAHSAKSCRIAIDKIYAVYLENGSGDGHPLFFSSAQLEASFSNDGVVTIGKSHDLVVNVSRDGSLLHL